VRRAAEADVAAWALVPAEIDNVAAFLVLGSLSAMLFSMAKAGFGAGLAMLAVLIMVAACGRTTLATGIMLPILIAADYAAVASWLGKWSWPAVRAMLPGTVAGIAIGWGVLHAAGQLGATSSGRAAEAVLRLAVGGISLAFVALQAARWLRGRAVAFRPVFWQATAAGSAAGLCSTLAHAAGPIVTMYLLPQEMPKGRYVASTALFFWIANQLKLVPYFSEGLIDRSTLSAGMVFVPAIAAGAVLGLLLHKRVNQRQFNAVVYVLLAMAGGWMVQGAVRALLD